MAFELALTPMSTAIVWVQTDEGFVIGADGFRLDGATVTARTETAQKIFFAKTNKIHLAYALCGATSLDYPYGTFSFSEDSAKIASVLENSQVDGFEDYVETFMRTLRARFVSFNEGISLTGRVNVLPKRAIVSLCFIGHFDGKPGAIEGSIGYREKPFSIGDIDRTPLFQNPEGFRVFSGAKSGINILEREPPPTLAEPASSRIGEYLQFCKDNNSKFGDCKAIGGHIHVAAVTSSGFRWIVEPVPT